VFAVILEGSSRAYLERPCFFVATYSLLHLRGAFCCSHTASLLCSDTFLFGGFAPFWAAQLCAMHSFAHALRLFFALNATLQLVALVATAVALTAYARVHFVICHHFLDSPEKGMCFSSWLFLKVPILRRCAEL
jgi:hypothetical protein